MEGSEKLTGRDKAVLGFIWISSFVYALLNDQVPHHQHPTITAIKRETKISSLVYAIRFITTITINDGQTNGHQPLKHIAVLCFLVTWMIK